MIRQLIELARGALTFDDGAFLDMRDAPDGFQKALVLMVAVSLLVGLVASGISLVQQLAQPPLEAQFEEAERGIEEALTAMEQFGRGMDPQVRAAIETSIREGFRMGQRISEIVVETTPLPMPVSTVFRALGEWISAPFGWLGTWMFYGLIVLVIAKLMGGTATVQEMLSTTALSVAPHVLDAFGPLLGVIPCVGSLAAGALGLATFVWGLAIYAKGTAIANRFSTGKALVAVLLPIILAAVVALVLGLFFITSIISAIGSAQ